VTSDRSPEHAAAGWSTLPKGEMEMYAKQARMPDKQANKNDKKHNFN
jgi:hypothetical protein